MLKKLSKYEAVRIFIEQTKKEGYLAFDVGRLEDIFGSDVDYGDFGLDDIIPYIEEFCKLKNLSVLNFAYQNITYIPYSFKNLKNIKEFNVAGNKLSEFPKIFYDLPKLNKIGVVKNKFSLFDFFYEIINISTEKNQYMNRGIILEKTFEKIYAQIFDFYKKKHFEIIEKKWGLTIKNDYYTLYFFCDEQVNLVIDRENIAVCLEPKKDAVISKYKIFKEVEHLFKQIKNATNLIGELYYLPLGHSDSIEIIAYSELLKYHREGKTQIKDYSVYDIILNIGGRELLEDLESEKIKKISQANKFFIKNKTIKNVEITNFKLFENINVELSENINVVIGKNGYGKTSFLQAIAIGLAPIDYDEYEISSRIIYKKFINKKVLQKVAIYDKFASVTLNWSNFTQAYKIYPKTITLNQGSNSLLSNYLILAYGANLFSNEKKNHENIISSIVNENGKNYSIYSILENYTEHFYNPLTILQILTDVSISRYPDNKKEISQKVDLILNTLNIFLNIQEPEAYNIELNKSDNNVYIKGKYYFTNRKGKWELWELSEGYRKNILLITDILLRILAARKSLLPDEPLDKEFFAKVKGTILIDEFDKHLHSTWQRKLIFQLNEVFRNLQFILTTHNIFSLQSAEGGNALIIDTSNNKITINSKKITKGLSIRSIYSIFFDGKNNFFSYETEELFDEFYKLIVKVKRKEATENEISEFKEIITQLLDKDDEVQVIISRELRQMERQTGKMFQL